MKALMKNPYWNGWRDNILKDWYRPGDVVVDPAMLAMTVGLAGNFGEQGVLKRLHDLGLRHRTPTSQQRTTSNSRLHGEGG